MEKRLATILNHFGISPSQLAQRMGIQRSGISHILSGRNRPGLDFIIKLMQVFPQIDSDWLLTGKGELLRKTGQVKTQHEQETIVFPEKTQNKTENLTPAEQAVPGILAEKEKPGNRKGNLAMHEKNNPDVKEAEKILVLYKDGTYEEFVKR